MPSSSRQEQLAAQIAALQAQLAEEEAINERKRKATQHVRVAASPSPTKKRKIYHQTLARVSHAPPRICQPVFSRTTHNHASNAAQNTQKRVSSPAAPLAHKKEAPETTQSNLAASLTAYHAAAGDSDANAEEPVGRRPALGIDRNADLTLVESLQIGPVEHSAPTNDLLFNTIEPYSKINLRSRSLDYEDEQEFLRGRYYVSPSMLYSIVRLAPNRQGYDVPVDSDWVTIAVIAERGDISVSRGAKTGAEDQANEDLEANREKSKGDGIQKRKRPPTSKRNDGGKKYMTLRLVDFGRRCTDPQTGKVSIGGDALLNLILFEAESYSAENTGAGGRVYKGGSGGAFENAVLLRAGTVIAVMSPKILKPFQRGTDKPHPTDNILALTPTDAKSIVIIGHSKDLGKCPALKRDGTPCGSWCDRRVSEVCDYHVQRAVQSRRAARPEFASSTSGMSTSAKPSHRNEYGPSRKWGLLPAAGMNPAASKTSASLGGGTTYVMPGVVVSSQRDKTLSEVMGREKHNRKRRQAEKETQERELAKLIEQDGGKTGGAKAVVMARQALAAKREPKSKGNVTTNKDVLAAIESKGSDSKTSRRVFSAMAIKHIGFDPSAKSGTSGRHYDNSRVNRILENLTTEKTEFRLGHMPGIRIRSGVFPPTLEPPDGADEPQDQGAETCTLLPRAEGSDDDLWVV